MKHLLAFLLFAAAAFAQSQSHSIAILPSPDRSTTGARRFYPLSGANYVALRAPSTIPAPVTWTLPATDGTAGYALTTNGAGVLSWSAAGGSSPPFPNNTYLHDIEGSTGTSRFRVSSSTAGQSSSLEFYRRRGTIASPADVQAGDQLSAFSFFGYKDGSDRLTGLIRGIVDSVATNIVSSHMLFSVANSGGSLVDVLKVAPTVITATGNLVPNTTNTRDLGSSSLA